MPELAMMLPRGTPEYRRLSLTASETTFALTLALSLL